ncbi:MAG: dipeptidyl aminopeptidase/acylaminoacyl peptidase [Alteromonadaceae bacterium]|jgi:dipeptidyl aminopeptidase/acylaminoacyl peptidase
MSAMTPIQLKARDGVDLHGYLTLPASQPKNAPLIVYLHGGPHGVRDHWEYQDDVQFLASRGYAVLQVNFRGSGGYGGHFEYQGHHQWGDKMIKDIVDATRWTLKNHPVNSDKICTMGGSYGAFAALSAAVEAPEMFDCVIGISGVYDLELLSHDTDIVKSSSGDYYLKEVLGTDKKQLQAQSPINHLDKLTAPMLIIHGKKDKRTPLEQAEQLQQKFDAKKHPYQWMLMDLEAHGVYKPENRVKMYQKIEAFLKQYLGS